MHRLRSAVLSHASAVAQGNVVRAMASPYAKGLYLALRTDHPPKPINIKFGTIHNIGGLSKWANFHRHRLYGGAPTEA
jgi:hypothetical protein